LTELVLDASVVLKWFREAGERRVEAAHAIRTAFERGALEVIVPSLIRLEIINVAARSWMWDSTALAGLAVALDELGFELREPDLGAVARWASQGLTAYDAAYVALAETTQRKLVTDDDLILSTAPGLTLNLEAGAGAVG
jgi:predicted nucleic acid-binding protein